LTGESLHVVLIGFRTSGQSLGSLRGTELFIVYRSTEYWIKIEFFLLLNRNWNEIERILNVLQFLTAVVSTDFTFLISGLNNQIYKLEGNSSMHAKPFTHVTHSLPEEKQLNSAFATCQGLILLHGTLYLPSVLYAILMFYLRVFYSSFFNIIILTVL